MHADKKYFLKKKASERRVFNDFLFLDQLRLKQTPKSKYLEFGFSPEVADLLTDKYKDEPTVSAITKTHAMTGGDTGIFESENAMRIFSNILIIQHEEFSKLLKAIALKASTEMLISLFPIQLESRKCVGRLRKDYAEHINAEYKSFLERKREKYKEFNPTDSGIDLMVKTKPRRAPRLSFLETRYTQQAFRELAPLNLSDMDLHIQCAEEACVLVSQVASVIETERAYSAESGINM